MSQKNGDFGDFSLSDDDLYKDFLQKEEQYDNSGFDSDEESQGSKKESDLLGRNETPQKSKVSSLEEEISKNKKMQPHGDIQSLMAMVKKDRDYDISDDAANEDMLEAFRRQQATNKHIASSMSDLPSDIHLIDDPIDVTYDPPSASAGDEKLFKYGGYFSMVLSAITIALLSVSIYINTKPEDEVVARPPEVTQGTGDIINNAISENDLTATVTTAPGADGESSSDDADSDSSDSSSSSSDGNSDDIRYEIISEGGIKTASISYINASGSRESETGVALPWKKSVKNASSITPHIAANPGERGTLTCKIYKGNEKIAEDTAAGENASVECKAD